MSTLKSISSRVTTVQVALAVSLSLVSMGALAQAPAIPDLNVSGPNADFEMNSRLMTSGKRMEVWLTIPGKGKVKMPKFNGTFFYRDSNPQATSATLMFRSNEFVNVEGKMAKELTRALDFKNNPFFAFQSRSAAETATGVELRGKLIVKDRETDVTLQMKSPGEVAVDPAKNERWIAFEADMEVDASAVGLETLGEVLRFEFKMFLFNYTMESAIGTGIKTAALDRDPPRFPRDAESLSNAGWYLMYRKRFTEAIEAFDKSIELNPTYVSAYLRRGDAFAFNRQYGKAVGTYRLMWDIMPVHPHLIELRKVLAGEYLTPASLSDSNKRWQLTQ